MLRTIETSYIIESGQGHRAYLQVETEEEAFAKFAVTKAKVKWGRKPKLVRETREILEVQA